MALIILDRDGVINEDSDNFIKSVEEFIFLENSIEAIAALSKAGHTIVIATNQSGIARGYFNEQTLNDMHEKLIRAVEKLGGKLDGIFYCPHGPEDNCNCRKPLAGLVDQIFSSFGASFSTMYLVGDSIRDLQTAYLKHITPVLVRTGKGKKSENDLKNYPELSHTLIFNNLSAFADDFLGGQI